MKKEKNDETFLKSRGLIILILMFLFILVLTFFFGDSGIIEILRSQDKIAELRSDIEELEKKKIVLEQEIKELEKNPLALEKTAREKLWLMKKNEKVIIVVEKKDKDNVENK
ncbi:MAG: septum formation initiator family protein [Candidatus Aminicenantes bacterium]|nr:septum formation initiator family protein [Candidatus Aminicenantes bacterium]